MTLGYIGLGKMGSNMVLRLLEHKHTVYVWNRTQDKALEMQEHGAIATDSIKDLVEQLRTVANGGRIILWMMLPAGSATEEMIAQLGSLLLPGDILIDGANSRYTDTIRRAQELSQHEIFYIDAAISGGPAGARHGACVMLGGDRKVVEQLEELWTDIAQPGGYAYFGTSGAGHFVKMVHNGIEYGMMQAIGEGFAVLQQSGFDLDLQEVCRLYNTGSVIESRLIGWLQSGFAAYGQDLSGVSGSVAHSGEGQWTVETASALEVPVPIIAGSLQFRKDSESSPSYTGQLVSVMRNQFGGHTVTDEKNNK